MNSTLIRAIAFTSAFALLAGPAAFAKDKKKKADSPPPAAVGESPSLQEAPSAVELSRSGEFSLETSLAWADAGTSGSTDYGAASGGPAVKLDFESGWDLSFRDSPALRTGGFLAGSVKATMNDRSPSDSEPYMVIDGVTIESIVGWYLGADFGHRAWSFRASASLEGGLRVLDLAESDFDYQPVSAEGKDYWFRVLPVCASTQRVALSLGKSFNLSLKNRLLFWRQSEDAYGEEGKGGYEEKLKAELSIRLAKTRYLAWSTGLAGSAKLESGLVVPKRSGDLFINADIDIKRVGLVRLSPIGCEFEGEYPQSSVATDRRFQLSGSVEVRPDTRGGSWLLSLSWPWAAWDEGGNSDAALAEWKLTLGTKLKD